MLSSNNHVHVHISDDSQIFLTKHLVINNSNTHFIDYWFCEMRPV